MGGFYGSLQIRCADRDRVIAELDELAERHSFQCLVGPVLSGWIGVYPSDAGQSHRLGQILAEHIGGIVWHVMVHDDSVLAYWLWRDGSEVDSYWSLPGYFGEEDRQAQERMTGAPEKLSQLVGGNSDQLRALLAPESQEVFEYVRLQKLGDLVSVENLVTSYEYLKRGDNGGITGRKKFTELPRSALKRKQDAKRAKRRLIKSFLTSGILLCDEEVAQEGMQLRASLAPDGYIVFLSTLADDRPVRVTQYSSPSWSPTEITWELTGHVTHVASDATGSRIAIALGTHSEIWDATSNRKMRDIPAKEWTHDVAMNSTGTTVATIGRPGLTVYDVESGEQLFWEPPQNHRAMAIHPSGEWIVCNRMGMAFASVDHSSEWCEVPISLDIVPDDYGALLEAAVSQRSAAHGQWNSWFPDSADEFDTDERMPSHFGFSQNGEWLWCGTSRGIWVFRWAEVVADREAVKANWWYPTCEWSVMANESNHVYDVAEQPGGTSIRFCTLNGQLFELNLLDGGVRESFKWPEGTPIQLFQGPNEQTFGCITTTGMRSDENDPENARSSWQIWDGTRL